MPPKRLRTFPSLATAQQVALAAQPSLDPEDVVAAGHPQLAGYDCIAIPNVPCPESVLRLALAADTFPSLDLKTADLADIAPPLQVRCVAATIPELRRRLERLQHGDFPVYVLAPGEPGAPPQFALVDAVSMKEREDHWAIVFIPAWGANRAHWTFTTVVPPQKPADPEPHPALIFTSMPITDLSPNIYWRCKPTRANMAAYVVRKNMGLACHCCQNLTCPHEMRFKRAHPDARMITLGDDAVFDGEWRAQVLSAGKMDGHSVRLGKSATVDVVNPAGQISTHYYAWNVPAILRPAFNFGDGFGPLEAKAYCFDSGVGKIFPAGFRMVLGIMLRAKQTWEERLWPFYYWKYDIPKREEDIVIRPYRLRISELERRRASPLRMFMTTCTSAATGLLSWLIGRRQIKRCFENWDVRVTTHQPVKMRDWKLDAAVKFFGQEKRFTAWQVVTPDPKKVVQELVTAYWEPFGFLIKKFAYAPSIISNLSFMTIDRAQLFSACEKIPRLYVTCFYHRPCRSELLSNVSNTLLRLAVAGIAFYYCRRAYNVMKRSAFGLVLSVTTYHFKTAANSAPATRAFGDMTGSAIVGGKQDEINSRLACRDQITRSVAIDVFRRAMNETHWVTVTSPSEVDAWLETVVNTPGESVSIPRTTPGECVTCRRRVKTYRHECKECKKRRRTIPMEPLLGEPFVVYIGKVGLWSRKFILPRVELKPDAIVKFGGKKYRNYESIMSLLSHFEIETSCRGWNSGPMIDSHLPQCFPRGYAVAVQAFVVRLASARQHRAEERPWRLWYRVMSKKVSYPLEPEKQEVFLEHFRGEKRKKMEEAFKMIDEGYAVEVDELEPSLKMNGFQKAEKSYAYKMPDSCSFERKESEKPRFICCPSPEFLAEIGLYTHPQLKWLSAVCPNTSHMFYAGCATPAQMNRWLNWTLSEMPEPVTITDDITAIDSNHSSEGMKFHRKLRQKQYPKLSRRIEAMYLSEETISIRVGPFKLIVTDINASGVPDTSYKNSAPCIVHRVFALMHAALDLTHWTDSEILSMFPRFLKLIFTSAAGDDGLSRIPRVLFGTDMMSQDARDRYSEWWAKCGFSVKVAVLPSHRWRMATYLAMRPVWTGQDYEWAPEPARRLKGMFWQIDNSMHPTAWARGVATQVLQQGRHCPVLADICEWYLRITSGPIIKAEEKIYSPFANYETKGKQNERAIQEFCVDYHIERADLELMKSVLSKVESPYVNLGFFALRRVMLEES